MHPAKALYSVTKQKTEAVYTKKYHLKFLKVMENPPPPPIILNVYKISAHFQSYLQKTHLPGTEVSLLFISFEF